jgi:hypothetical protein
MQEETARLQADMGRLAAKKAADEVRKASMGIVLEGSGGSNNSSDYTGSTSERPGQDYGKCPGNEHVTEMGYTYNYAKSEFNAFHVVPSGYARYWGTVHQDTWLREFKRCVITEKYKAKSEQGLIDQLRCHDYAPGGYRTGPTWDLEGIRGPNDSRLDWINTRCAWK